MRVSDLASVSGIPVATIKFYIRERLLPAGASTSVNQATYSDHHVRRLRLIRALVDIAGLSIASAREVLTTVDADVPLNQVFATAQLAASRFELYSSAPEGAGRRRVDAVIAQHGWQVSEENPGRAGAAKVADSFAVLGHPELVDLIDDYADAAELVARADIQALARQPDVSAMADTVVAGTVLGDAMFAALRRMAQEHVSREQFPPEAPGKQTDRNAS
ncbi:MerR family transcriptional regulator [Arthrobacter sp. H5]|uniref:MerR family transcriptional regulator n=1 Tax=Arthrobacter sp. H5 TaxID=1267973 RepID=UPI000484298C|nr:MerR family transcriptional regulator [Arthrobacter sp. H5]